MEQEEDQSHMGGGAALPFPLDNSSSSSCLPLSVQAKTKEASPSLSSSSTSSSLLSPCESSASSGGVRVFSSPLLWLQNESYFEDIPESSGCLIFQQHQEAKDSTTSSSNDWTTMEEIQGLLEGNALALTEQCILASPIDSVQEIQQSIALCRATISANSSRDTFCSTTIFSRRWSQ